MGNRRKQDVEFFSRLYAQMEEGGYGAMLHALTNRAYRAETLRSAPKTDALVRQILEGLQSDLSWWLTVLVEGRFPVRDDDWNPLQNDPQGFKPGQRLFISKDAVMKSYRSFVHGHRNAEVNAVTIGMFIARHAKGLMQPRGGPDNARSFDFPPLEQLRKQFCDDLGGAVEFGEIACEVETRAANDHRLRCVS